MIKFLKILRIFEIFVIFLKNENIRKICILDFFDNIY